MDTLEASRALVRQRISYLRGALVRHGLAGYLVPSSDPHLSEYLPQRWQAREWLSGFTGSVATLIVTADFAGLWVDSRYWVQAESQLSGTGIELMKIGGASSTAHFEWLAANLEAGSSLGADGAVLGLATARALEDALRARGIKVRFDLDLLEEIWSDRPSLSDAPVFEHAAQFASATRASKLALIREAMAQNDAQWHLVSTLDDIAWMFNLRGADVAYNPVFAAHALITPDAATLFARADKFPPALRERLLADGVAIEPYEKIQTALAALPSGTALMLDPRRITLGQRLAVAPGVAVIEVINPSTLAKSRKNSDEAKHVRAAMEEDGAALAEFFAWFEGALGHERITELTIDEKITAARARRSGFVSPSFGTIAGFNGNGAMPHYRATEGSHAVIEGDGLLLIDSGGQYQFGTTDITRVVPVGTVSAEQKRDFTVVLKGMIALARAKFPRGTRSPTLDALARAPIWAEGIHYGHRTGHGVGYFLKVHEGPQSN